MKINQNQISDYLAKNKKLPHNLIWVNSEDSFLLQDALKKIRKHANANKDAERIVFHIDNSCDWDEIISCIQTPSLFTQDQIIELHFATKITANEQQELIKISELLNNNTSNICIVSYPFRVDAKTLKAKWMQQLDKYSLIVTIWPLSVNDYPKWLSALCKSYKINFNDQSSLQYLCEKTMGNPGVAAQTLFKLRLQNISNVNIEILNNILSEHSNYTIFDLTDNFLINNTKQSCIILDALKRTDTAPLLIIWTLRKELLLLAEIFEQAITDNIRPQAALNNLKLWSNKKGILSQAINKFNLNIVHESLHKIATIEEIIKTENNPLFVWQQIEQLILINTVNFNTSLLEA